MQVSDLFTQVNSAYRGSDDDPPTSGVDFTLWLATANRKQGEWCRDTKNNWASLWSVDTLSSSIADGTQSYDLDETLLIPSDRVTVTVGTQLYYYTICKPEERDRFNNAAYISGNDPKQLTFVDTIDSTSPILGGTITIGGYHVLEDLTSGGDTIFVDDPYWLVYATAAELAFNDLTYSDKSPDLNNKANALYDQMVANNRRGTSGNPRTLRTDMGATRILDPMHEGGV